MQLRDLTGMRFGRLIVIDRAEDHYYPSGRHDVQYICKCDCGNVISVLGIHLRSGHTASCGCLRADVSRDGFTTHGMTNTRLHTIWKNMKERCNNERRDDYALYGGRGIAVCDEWRDSFMDFYTWAMRSGYEDGLTLDRIDVNGNYSPSNCRWVTQKDQCNNTRKNINVSIGNETHTLKQWCEILNLKYGTIASRVSRGWPADKALTTPVRSVVEHS